jgi:hypothetical protein
VKEATAMIRPKSTPDRAPGKGRDRGEGDERTERDEVAEPGRPAIDQDVAGPVNAALPESDD